MTCSDEPPVPDTAASADIAGYLLDLVDAGQSCRDAVAAIREWTDANKKPESE